MGRLLRVGPLIEADPQVQEERRFRLSLANGGGLPISGVGQILGNFLRRCEHPLASAVMEFNETHLAFTAAYHAFNKPIVAQLLQPRDDSSSADSAEGHD